MPDIGVPGCKCKHFKEDRPLPVISEREPFEELGKHFIDGTIRNDIHPLKMSLYLMISLMGIMAHEHKWDRVIEAEGINNDEFVLDFFRFITPAVSKGEKPHTVSFNEAGGPFGSLFFSVEPVVMEKKPKK